MLTQTREDYILDFIKMYSAIYESSVIITFTEHDNSKLATMGNTTKEEAVSMLESAADALSRVDGRELSAGAN